jgi:hypothetical protein
MEQKRYMVFFALQIRHRFGCYDEITEVDRRRVRHCNWVRFLRAASTYSDEVNMIGTKVKGKRHLMFCSLLGWSGTDFPMTEAITDLLHQDLMTTDNYESGAIGGMSGKEN